ncbi:MAG: MFS transporter [Pseudomonadota bacterium]
MTDSVTEPRQVPFWRSVPFVVFCGSMIAMLTFGPRSAMGFFQIPMLADMGWDRTTFALAMAIQNLMWGLGQPFFGALADKRGTFAVLTLGAAMYIAGLVMMAWAPSPLYLHLGGGVLVGLGVSAGSFGIVLAALARRVSAEQRTFVFGIGTAAGSMGMFIFSPLSQALIDLYGWSDALVGLAILMGLIPIFAFFLGVRPVAAADGKAQLDQSIREALAEALGHRDYMLLISGFFVCGFQVAFITAHFPAYINDLGIDATWGVVALALIGLFNIIGSLASGIIGQRYSKPIFLSLIYIGRSIAVTAFLLVPATPLTVTLFAVVMGLLWLSTVAPTNALVAVMFGTRYLGMLGGIVFLSHQVGSFLGVWLGGVLYDQTGSYDMVWWIGVALGLFAAIVHWPIREVAVERPQPAV